MSQKSKNIQHQFLKRQSESSTALKSYAASRGVWAVLAAFLLVVGLIVSGSILAMRQKEVTNQAATFNNQQLSDNARSSLKVAPLVPEDYIVGGNLDVAGALGVNTITSSTSMLIGSKDHDLTLQGSDVSLSTTAGGVTNTLRFATPSGSSKSIVMPNASGTIAVSASGPLALDANGNLSCPACTDAISNPTVTVPQSVTGSLNAISGDVLLQGTSNQIVITNSPGSKQITLSLPQDINTNASPVFANINITQSLRVANAIIAGSLTLTSPLAVSSGGTGVVSLAQNGVVVGQATDGLTTVIASGVGQCLVSTAGVPTFQSCPGSGGVSSLNGASGAVTLDAINPTSIVTTGNTITIQNASSIVRGLASFNGANLTVTDGDVNTIQNIAVTAVPTFAGLNLTSALAVVSGGTGLGSTPLAGQLLIGNGAGYSLSTLSAGAGVTITNNSGSITIASPGSGTCASCANQALSNLNTVALNTSLLPGTNNTIDLGASNAAFRNGYIAGVMQVGSLDAASAAMLSIGGANATSIGLNKNTVQASGTSLTMTGGITGTRPASPSAGALYYDSTTNQLVQYNGTKWISDRTTSTKIVAASNSNQATKDAADYVATGTGDQSTINAALTAASGGAVYLAEGTYSVTAAVSIPNNTTLAGAGAGTLITIPNAQNTSYNIITNTDTTTGTRVTIRDLRIDGNMANQTNGNTNGVYLNGMGGGAGITARDGAKIVNLVVRGTRIQSTSTAGIHLTNSSNNTLTGNTLQGNGHYGIYLSAASNSNTIGDNIMQGNGRGLEISSSFYNIISGNAFQGNSTWVLLLSGGGSNTVTGNTIQGGQYGIALSGAPSNDTVTGNNISGVSPYGIYVHATGANISANKIHDSGGGFANNGIYLFIGSNNTIIGNDISDTSCTTNCYAIDISSASLVSTYLSDNRHNGTVANSSIIRDNGIGTIYSNQPDGLGNLINKSQGGGLTVGAASATASLTLQGGILATALPVPTLSSTVTNTGTVGTTTYRYQITALDGQGETTGSTIQQTTAGNATLSATNYNTITWTAVGGAYQYRIYRCAGVACTPALLATVAGNTASYRDQAAGVPTGAVPSTNTTGGANFAGQLQGSSATLSGGLNVAGTGTLGALTVSGASLFKNAVDSTSAFQIQKSDGSSLFVADTTNMRVTVAKLVVSGDITVGGHVITAGTAPTIAAGPAACTAPAVSVVGNDTSGIVTVTTGTGCAATGRLATVNFNAAFGTAPRISLTATSADAANLRIYSGSTTASSFTIDTTINPLDTTTLTFNYWAVQ